LADQCYCWDLHLFDAVDCCGAAPPVFLHLNTSFATGVLEEGHKQREGRGPVLSLYNTDGSVTSNIFVMLMRV
jgi:hypothetical protein